jgi:hypothetical protein
MMTTFVRRFLGALWLVAATYEEVESDRRATAQAVLVVVLSSVASGLSVMGMNRYDLRSLLIGTVAAVVGWLAWATLAYLVGVRLLPESQTRADIGQLLRTLGFASAPGVVRIVGLVPGFAWPIYVGTSLWILAAMVVAVRQALDFTTTRRAVAVCAVGWLLVLVLTIFMSMLLGSTVQSG